MCGDLPGSVQIVLSRSARESSLETVQYVRGVDGVVTAEAACQAERAYVLDDATVYELFYPVVTELVLSRIPGAYMGDTYFPDWDRDAWRLRERIGDDGFTLDRWVRVDRPAWRLK